MVIDKLGGGNIVKFYVEVGGNMIVLQKFKDFLDVLRLVSKKGRIEMCSLKLEE